LQGMLAGQQGARRGRRGGPGGRRGGRGARGGRRGERGGARVRPPGRAGADAGRCQQPGLAGRCARPTPRRRRGAAERAAAAGSQMLAGLVSAVAGWQRPASACGLDRVGRRAGVQQTPFQAGRAPHQAPGRCEGQAARRLPFMTSVCDCNGRCNMRLARGFIWTPTAHGRRRVRAQQPRAVAHASLGFLTFGPGWRAAGAACARSSRELWRALLALQARGGSTPEPGTAAAGAAAAAAVLAAALGLPSADGLAARHAAPLLAELSKVPRAACSHIVGPTSPSPVHAAWRHQHGHLQQVLYLKAPPFRKKPGSLLLGQGYYYWAEGARLTEDVKSKSVPPHGAGGARLGRGHARAAGAGGAAARVRAGHAARAAAGRAAGPARLHRQPRPARASA